MIDSTISESSGGRDSFRLMHQNDYWFGQSGGPAYGWWDGEPWPRVVGIYSAVNWGGTGGPNANGGGNPLSELIDHARTVEPWRRQFRSRGSANYPSPNAINAEIRDLLP